MIEGIDIFEPRENGLPDFSKISPGQIFNGSVAASLNNIKDPYGLLKEEKPKTTINPFTGEPVEARKARAVPELLSGGSPAARGHRRLNSGQSRAGGGSPARPVDDAGNYNAGEPLLPETDTPSTLPNADLLTVPGVPEDYVPPQGPESSLFPQVDLTPEEKKQAALRRLPTMLLEELSSMSYI